MKNDGMLSIGKPGHFGEKSQKFNHGNKQIKRGTMSQMKMGHVRYDLKLAELSSIWK